MVTKDNMAYFLQNCCYKKISIYCEIEKYTRSNSETIIII